MDPVLFNYTSSSNYFIFAGSFLSFCSLCTFSYSVYTLIQTFKLELKSEQKSISRFLSIIALQISLSKIHSAIPVIIFRNFLSLYTTASRFLFEGSFTLYSLILARISYYLIDLYLHMEFYKYQDSKEKILRVSMIGLYSACIFQFIFKVILIIWPYDAMRLGYSFNEAIGLINFMFILISAMLYVVLVLMIYKKLNFIADQSIVQEIKSNLRLKVLTMFLIIFSYSFAIFIGIFWDQLGPGDM